MRWFRRSEVASEPMRRVSSTPAPRRTKPFYSPAWIGRSAWLEDETAFLSDFYSYMRRRVPLISNAVSAWVDLSTSGSRVLLDGGSQGQQKKAQEILRSLDYRVYEFGFEWGLGLKRMMELFFLGLYTDGRFCAELVPFADGNGIAYVGLVDPFTIRMKQTDKGVKLYQKVDEDDVELPQHRMFYAAYDPDSKHTYGVSLLDSVSWVVEIKEKMLEDMARSSHNAGYPRLHVSMAPPEQLPGESSNDYVGRANTDFDETVKRFRDLDVDDNVFTWSHVNVETVGGGGDTAFNWAINLERVVEEVISGLHLYAWVLGYSHGTTKNWVDAQHDLLMQRVQRGAAMGVRFMNWVRNSELAMVGSPVRTTQQFKPLRDPGQLIEARAENFEWIRVRDMVKEGFIDQEQGKRLLGIEDEAYGI